MAKQKKSSKVAIERGRRIRYLREALRYSRPTFAEKYSFSPRTLENWEEPRWDGVTVVGAQKLIDAFKGEGLQVTLEWLFQGQGPDPLIVYEESKDLYRSHDNFSDPAIIAQELVHIHQLHKNIIDTVIADDGMAPLLTPGDHVIGRRLVETEMEKAIGYVSIAQTSNSMLVRMIERGSDTGRYTLRCLNPQTTVAKPILENMSLVSVAPIIWMRKVNVKI